MVVRFLFPFAFLWLEGTFWLLELTFAASFNEWLVFCRMLAAPTLIAFDGDVIWKVLLVVDLILDVEHILVKLRIDLVLFPKKIMVVIAFLHHTQFKIYKFV